MKKHKAKPVRIDEYNEMKKARRVFIWSFIGLSVYLTILILAVYYDTNY